jgi:FHA domain
VTGRLSQIGRQWSRLREFFEGPPGLDAPPLEICCAVLDDLERRVQPVGEGRRVFPYNRVVIRVVPVSADRPALQAAFDGLGARLRRRLEELRCEVPDAIEVNTVFVNEPADQWPDGRVFSIECERDRAFTVERPGLGRSALHISVVNGAATEAAYRFHSASICVGRTAEATDGAGRVRRNDVAFLDSVDGVTETVGRAHARFRLDERTGEYRLHDEGSRNGTWIVRHGTTIAVPPRDPCGVRVESGDEVRLGRALIRVSIELPA